MISVHQFILCLVQPLGPTAVSLRKGFPASFVHLEFYTDQDLTDLFLTSSAICQALDEGHLLCNIVTTHEGPEYGITTSTGIAQFEEDGTTGTATFVFTGGTDDFEGIAGFIESDYHADGNVHHVCRQD